MQENCTTHFQTESLSFDISETYTPKESTIRNILQFAASYQVKEINAERFVDIVLN